MQTLHVFAASVLAYGLATDRGPNPAPGEQAGQSASSSQLWLYCPTNLLVDENVAKLDDLWRRAAKMGYTHVLLADSKFCRLVDMEPRYFHNVDRVKALARELRLTLVPAVMPIGYSNDILSRDPNLVEALPVREALFVVHRNVARHEPEPRVELKGGDFNDLSRWDWKDECVTADAGAARVADPNGRNARIVQKLNVAPFRQYHVSVRVKTADFAGTPEAKILADGRALTFINLGVKPTQDWTVHHTVFNSLDHTEVALYLGCWDGRSGSLWWDDAKVEEIGLLNVVRRPGAPLTVHREMTGDARDPVAWIEGQDFERVVDPDMGVHPWPGEYDVWHEPPVIRLTDAGVKKLPDGSRLRVSYYHAITIHDGQAMICPSEPKTLEILRDHMRRVHEAFGASAYFMSHDEIRVLNWCDACQKRHLTAGQILAENLRQCTSMVREVAPDATLYVWSDMFDPHHNAGQDYYLVRGDLARSWEGLDPKVIVAVWYLEKRAESLKWFADRGNPLLIAGYYDAPPTQVLDWLTAARDVKGVTGVMYTTWRGDYEQIGPFADTVRGEVSHSGK
ncbi:MAG: hypothetical protein IT449_02815 [Phycisphaerales bacterium]|nr:hypothetical protein [Phycisphaerales bacterium]